MKHKILNRLALCTLGLCLAAAPTSVAQNTSTEHTVSFGSWQCERAALDRIIEMDRERTLPIAQAMVDEGLIVSAGTLSHSWGDEWNYVNFVVAADVAAVVEANGEMNRRYAELYPDDNSFIEHCSEHKDNIYSVDAGMELTGVVDPDRPPAYAMSYWKCPLQDVGRLIRQEDSLALPIARELVAEGLWRGTGFMSHDWADEWSVVRWAAADDIPSLIAAFDEQARRRVDRHPDSPESGLNECRAHKDNIYELTSITSSNSN